MNSFTQKLNTTFKTAALTLNFILLLIVVVQGYVEDQFDTMRVITVIIAAFNILFFLAIRPVKATQNENEQPTPQNPESGENQAQDS